MAIKNYSAAAETLIQLSGGKENFITVENCATRVRIQYKDLSKVDKKAIGEMDGVLSVIEKDGLQVATVVFGSTTEGKWIDTRHLADYVFATSCVRPSMRF